MASLVDDVVGSSSGGKEDDGEDLVLGEELLEAAHQALEGAIGAGGAGSAGGAAGLGDGLGDDVDDVGALSGTGGEDDAVLALDLLVLLLQVVHELLLLGLLDKGDGAAAEAAAGHTGAEDTLHLLGGLDQEVELLSGDLVVVLEGLVGLVEVLAGTLVVVVLQALDALVGTDVLGDGLGMSGSGDAYVEGSSVLDLGDLVLDLIEHVGGAVAEGLDLGVELGDGLSDLLAGGDSLGVLGAGEGVLAVAVANDDGDLGVDEGDELGLLASAVDEEGVVLLAAGGDELVHDTAYQ